MLSHKSNRLSTDPVYCTLQALTHFLPTEIQLLILSKVDGTSLCHCRLVCKLWSNLVFRLEAFNNIWQKCCKSEIPEGIFSDLIDIYIPSLNKNCDVKDLIFENADWISWKAIYGHYFRYRYVKDKPTSVTEYYLPTQFGAVSCLELCDNEMVLGFEDGSVICYDENAVSNTSHPLVVHKGTEAVRRIVSFKHHRGDYQSEPMVVITTHHTSALLVSNVIIQNGRRSTTFTNLDYHSKPVTSISQYGPYFTTASSDTVIQHQPIWYLDKTGSTYTPTLVCRLFIEEPKGLIATCMWRDKIVSVDAKCNILTWTLDYDHLTLDPLPPTHAMQAGCSGNSLIYRHNVFLCLTGLLNRSLYVQHRGTQKLHNVYASVAHLPHQIALHGSLLVIGTEAAMVYVYVLNTDADWYDLDLQKYDRCVKVEGRHITGLHIDDHGSGPLIIVTSDAAHITIIHWNHG